MRRPEFAYDRAFARNLGWLTDWEQVALRAKRVAIAGLGGVGGAHLLTLARFGVGAFTIADFDRFDLANFNRQAGATMATLDRPKAEVMDEMARAINPDLRIARFDTPLDIDSVDSFLANADLFIDGLDFFEIPIRRHIFARCAALGIPALTAAPIGMGVGFLAFDPRGMSFNSYFRFEGQPENEQFLRFLIGLAPAGLHRSYLVDPSRVDLAARKGPSTVAAIQLCAGVTAAAAVKLLLGRGGVPAAPYHLQFDAYRGRLATRRLRFGNAGLMQRLKIAIARRQFLDRLTTGTSPPSPSVRTEIEDILDLGRWAPSGDNRQPWRFRIRDVDSVEIELVADPLPNLYDAHRDGEPTWLAAGMLLETLRCAASLYGRGMDFAVLSGAPASRLRVQFPAAPELPADPLTGYISLRSVERRGFRRRPLTAAEKAALEASLPDDLAIDWHEGIPALWRFGALNARATAIRLRAMEAFEVHARVIDWQRRLSPNRIPAGAVGLPGAMLPLMRWAMARRERMDLLNRLGAAATTAWQLDRLPALRSAAFFVVRAAGVSRAPTARPERLLRAGMGIQRFWLTATRLNLSVQPTLAPLIFAEHARAGLALSPERALAPRLGALAEAIEKLDHRPPEEVLFLGRIGERVPRLPSCRSTRLPLSELIA